MEGVEISPGTIRKFTSEFGKGEFFDFEGYRINYSEFSPNPEDLISPKPIIFIGGFGKKAGAYQKEILKLVASGRKVIFTNPLRGIKLKQKTEFFAERGEMRNLPQVIKDKANEILAIMQNLKIENADVVGHSQGGMLAIVLATALPNLVDKLVLLNPAGLQGKDSTLGLIRRSLKDSKKFKQMMLAETDKKKKEKMNAEAHIHRKYYVGNEDLFWRLTQEIPVLAKVDILPMLEDIKKQGRTKITLVKSNADITFPTEKTLKNLHQTQPPREEFIDSGGGYTFMYIDNRLMFDDKNASHNHSNPELLCQILNEGLKTIEQK